MTNKIIWNFIHESYLNCSDLRDAGYEYKFIKGFLIKSTDNHYNVAFINSEKRSIMFRISKNYKLTTMWSDEIYANGEVIYR